MTLKHENSGTIQKHRPPLQTARWVFDEGNNAQKEAMRDLALQGLSYLTEELRYDREDHGPDDDVPLLRWRSAQLALSMAEAGSKNAPAVSRWLEIAENDPATRTPICKTSCYHPRILLIQMACVR